MSERSGADILRSAGASPVPRTPVRALSPVDAVMVGLEGSDRIAAARTVWARAHISRHLAVQRARKGRPA